VGVGARVTVGVGVLEATGVGEGSGVSVGRGVGVWGEVRVAVATGSKGTTGVTPTQPATTQPAKSKQADPLNNKDPLILEVIW